VFAVQNGDWITCKGICTKANDQQAGRAVGNCLKRFALRIAESGYLGPLRQWQVKRSPVPSPSPAPQTCLPASP